MDRAGQNSQACMEKINEEGTKDHHTGKMSMGVREISRCFNEKISKPKWRKCITCKKRATWEWLLSRRSRPPRLCIWGSRMKRRNFQA
ncbi:hypothetical protein Trydic_g15610 [Trypoxylus dichotomus]